MESKSVFDYEMYKPYLLHVEESQARGFRSKLAKALRVQPAYVSQVLGGHADFTAEQAETINGVLGHRAVAADYFVLLVQHARAGTESLRNRILSRMEQARKSRLRLKEQFQLPTLDSERQAIYYGSWHFAAVHVASSIPELNSAKDISAKLGISIDDVQGALDFLIAAEIVSEKNGRLSLNEFRLHLEDDSPFIKQHHNHWRSKAIEAVNLCPSFSASEQLHYSSIVTVSESDVKNMRLIIQEFLFTAKARIRASKEERVCVFNLDFFPIDS